MLLHNLIIIALAFENMDKYCKRLLTHQRRKYPHRLHLVEAADLILRHLKAKVCCQPHQGLAVHSQGLNQGWRGLVHHFCGNLCEDFFIGSLLASTVRRTQKYNSDRHVADRLILWLYLCLK
jgi:hypothetical protein